MVEGRVRSRPLGATGIEVSEIGLGCGNWGREIDEESSNRLMDYAVERGITLFDTGEAYGGGESYETRKRVYGTDDVREASLEKGSSERIIGTWMRRNGCRDEITVMSKFNSGASADNIPRALSGSLGRLDTDFVDVYLLHTPDPDVPVAETVEALSVEVDAGRVGVTGCSNHSAAQFREALDASDAGGHRRYGVLQTAYSLAWPDTECEALPLCQAEGIGVTAFSPLGAGFLTGKYTPDRNFPEGSRYHIMPAHADIYFTDHNFGLLEKLAARARELGVPQVRLAMAWVMTHPAVSTVLVGARTTAQIDNAIEARAMGMDPELRAELSSWTRPRF
jgi:aryl-alcohol dehydrogenase-like predicted oxidoreductase